MHPQGVHSPTFSAAPIDGSLTIPQLLERQLSQSPNHIAYIYDDPQGKIVSVSFSQYIRTVHAGCRRVLHDVAPSRRSEDGERTVVGIFAIMDTISYCMLVAAIERAGMIPFCISPRSAAEGLANMLQQTKTAAVYVSLDGRLRGVLSDALALCKTTLPVLEAPTFEALQAEVDTIEVHMLPPVSTPTLESTAVILHSSGSTSIFSKPVYISHRMLLHYATVPWTSAEDHCGQILATHNLPNFHGIGIFLGTWPFTSGLTAAVLRPTTPPMLPTSQNALNGILATNPDLVLSSPASIEVWSDDPVGVKAMQSVKYLIYIGAPLNKRVGDALVAKGVRLCSCYGAMEVGLVTNFFTFFGKDWDYFCVREGLEAVRLPEEDGSGLYTHAYLETPTYLPCYTNTEIGGRRGVVVSDLLEQQPENPALHRVYGRKDDLIAFSSAAKMNPGPVEAQVNRNPLVDATLVFGHGRTYPGVIIQVKPEFQDDLLDTEKRTKILDALWMAVDQANSTSPTHFQIARKMIVLADPKRPFALTSKLQPRRRVVFEDYREEIDAAYAQRDT